MRNMSERMRDDLETSKPRFIQITFKHLFPSSQKTHVVCITKIIF